ncbi:MAG TPA: hypothetical protein PKZ97_03535 [Azospirillaceae bacterium]|nr:hypothetical protein [Azospirillaceae bacterium]HRQ80167.1 hypothetical protein [Azospirillaceae bacterium]
MSENQWLQLAAVAMAAILVFPAALGAAKKGDVLKHAAIWLALLAALAWGYEIFVAG